MAYKMNGFSGFGNSPAKQKGDKKAPGHGADPMPDVLYKSDGTAVKVSNIDEGQLDLRPSTGPKGKFVNYDNEDGTKTKYHYSKPK